MSCKPYNKSFNDQAYLVKIAGTLTLSWLACVAWWFKQFVCTEKAVKPRKQVAKKLLKKLF